MEINPRNGSVTYSSDDMRNIQNVLEEMRDQFASLGQTTESMAISEIAGHLRLQLRKYERNHTT